jgi:peroxiredoxin Q/BCP
MKTISLSALFPAVLALLLVATANTLLAADMPKVGDKAPVVTGKDESGKDWNLADRIGKKAVLLYFYPKDFTGGCTKQACSLRDNMGDLSKDNVEVIGVSFDSVESHKKFIAEHNLNFSLLADTGGKIADAYGVRNGEKNVARRVSFLIGLDGKIAHVTDGVAADQHVTDMKTAIAKLKKP